METRSGRRVASLYETAEKAKVPRKRKVQTEPQKKTKGKRTTKKQAKATEEPAEPKVTSETKEDVSKPEEQHADDSEILEKGLVYFFYRPKVGVEEVHGPEDVQKLYILMWPGAESIKRDEKEMGHTEGKLGADHPERLIILGKKKLPEVHGKRHERFWGFVDKVSKRIEDLDKQLGSVTYTTKTRGERHVEGARPIGEGVYALVKHHGTTHLAYVLELPEEPTGIQKAFNIAKEGSYVISVKNPDAPGVSFMRKEKKAEYPEELKKYFVGKTGTQLRFTTNVHPTLLDYEGTEILFISASDDLKEEFGEVGEYIEELEHVDAKKVTSDKLWKELHIKKTDFPAEPLLQNEWK
jgi:hypothetical protein